MKAFNIRNGKQLADNVTVADSLLKRLKGLLGKKEMLNGEALWIKPCIANGSIEVISKTIITEEGKKKRVIDKHIYRLGMCTFCALCVKTCPPNALAFSQEFEHAVFNRANLIKVSNKPGSQLMKGVE